MFSRTLTYFIDNQKQLANKAFSGRFKVMDSTLQATGNADGIVNQLQQWGSIVFTFHMPVEAGSYDA